ncbi:hypothetical protein A0H81_03045 [Grifola frondosa]|uniref:F-box domain-containing protein n=1 Tax=Grifola frondosa TaxID=5627 RepID=A0A1C7MI43_GRIFR|nr:hypothetical protein A0H81_03045 [Grifola frondosa]
MGVSRNDSDETRLRVPQQTLPELCRDISASDFSPQTLCSIEHHQQPTSTPAPFERFPVDIFYEILRWLEPLDLLQCARVSKRCRAVTLSPDAKPYWAAALRNVPGLPERAPDISEPRYAFLVFERFCEVCGAEGQLEVSYSYGCRLCGKCWEARYPHGFQLMVGAFLSIDHAVFELLPIFGVVFDKFDDFEDAWSDIAAKRFISNLRYSKTEFETVAAKYLRLRSDKAALAGFVAERKALVLERYKREFDVLKWKQSSQRSGS